MQVLVVLGLVAIGLINATLGLLVAFGGRRNATNAAFVLLAGSITLWSFGLASFLFTDNEQIAMLAVQAYYVAAIWIAGASLAFALGLFTRLSRKKLLLQYGAISASVLGMSVLSAYPSLMIGGIILAPEGNIVLLNAVPYVLYSTFFLTHILGAMYILYRKHYEATQRRVREQLRLILYGYVVAGVLGTIFNLIFPLLGNYKLVWVGPLFSVFLVMFIFRAIVSHKLFDIRSVLARTVAYILLITSMAALYGVAIFTVSSLFFQGDMISVWLNVTYIALAVILALTFQPMKRFFDIMTDKIFFKNDYILEDTLDQLGAIIAENIEVESVTRGTLKLLKSSLKPLFVIAHISRAPEADDRVFFSGESLPSDQRLRALLDALSKVKEDAVIIGNLEPAQGNLHDLMEKTKIDIIIRLKTAQETSGYLFFGEKQVGGIYRKKDLQLVNTAADELALAVQNSNRFREIQLFSKTLQLNIRKATAELRASNLKLKKLDESKDDFISMASHQLRTPLTSIKGYISMVLDGDMGKVTPEQRKVLEEAFSSSQRMVYLISDFLNVSRLQTGKFELELSPVQLPLLITDEIEQLQASAKSRNIELVYQAPKGFPMLTLDENKIRQVMMNFIDNAIYYAKPGGGTIVVTLAKHSQYIEFKVIDDGIGVPKSEQHQLFSKFYRATNARKARPDGTGIGLFMAKKVIVAHSGAILFESSEGKGSMFGFRLPLEPTIRSAPSQLSAR